MPSLTALLARHVRPAMLSISAGALCLSMGAAIHLRLVKSVPAKDAVVAEAPPALELWFSEPVELAITRVTLLDAQEQEVPLGEVRRGADSLAVTTTVEGPLAPGAFTVVWRTAAQDGHRVQGRYGFSVAPARESSR